MTKESKPRLPKHLRSAPALDNPPVVTAEDLVAIQAARALREKLQAIYETLCPCCGAHPTIPGLAGRIGVTESLLWRFINGKQATLMQDNFDKIQAWIQDKAVASEKA